MIAATTFAAVVFSIGLLLAAMRGRRHLGGYLAVWLAFLLILAAANWLA